MEYTGKYQVGQRFTMMGFTEVAKRQNITHYVEVKDVWVDDEGRNGVTIEPVRNYGFPMDVYEDILSKYVKGKRGE